MASRMQRSWVRAFYKIERAGYQCAFPQADGE